MAEISHPASAVADAPSNIKRQTEFPICDWRVMHLLRRCDAFTTKHLFQAILLALVSHGSVVAPNGVDLHACSIKQSQATRASWISDAVPDR